MGQRFFVRVPAGRDPQFAAAHADDTLKAFGAMFNRPDQECLAEPDGTYEVRVLQDSSASIVRTVLLEHERLEIVREEPL
jgi:hypothetical protein